jgi:ATP/maltotriose-dependent transcriptional regulator MalT
MRLAHAGLRALKRADLPAAVNLLERATRLLPDGEGLAETLCELGVALRFSGRGDRVAATFEAAAAAARRADARGVEVRVAVELVHAGLYGVGELGASPEEVDAAAAAALPVLEALDDRRGLARTWLAIGDAHSVRLNCARWGEAARAALTHYRAAGFAQSIGVSAIAAAAYWGAEPVPAAVKRCTELLAEVGDERMARASISMTLGGLEAMRGRFDEAGELLEGARQTFEEFGQRIALAASWSGFRARLAELAGDEATREQMLRASCEELASMGQHADLALGAAELADALQARGALDEASAMLRVGEEHSAPDDVFAQFVCSAVRAQLLARKGDAEEARASAGRAVALVEPTDALDLQARALLAAATVGAVSGESPQAIRPLVARAVALYRRKGNTVMAERAAAGVDALVT